MNSCAIQRDISESEEGVEVKRADPTTTSPLSLPTELSLKVAIRGLTVDTNPEEIVQFLREKWLEPEYAGSVK